MITTVFAACKNDSSDLDTNKVMLTDTTGNCDNSTLPDTATATKKEQRQTGRGSTERTNSSVVTSGSDATSKTNENTNADVSKKRPGWSSRAKDAVIGGAAGAVGGAIVSKHKGKGAIIGGLAGAAGGYIIGNGKDKKISGK
jgi:uncharacterized protein YcfJ